MRRRRARVQHAWHARRASGNTPLTRAFEGLHNSCVIIDQKQMRAHAQPSGHFEFKEQDFSIPLFPQCVPVCGGHAYVSAPVGACGVVDRLRTTTTFCSGSSLSVDSTNRARCSMPCRPHPASVCASDLSILLSVTAACSHVRACASRENGGPQAMLRRAYTRESKRFKHTIELLVREGGRRRVWPAGRGAGCGGPDRAGQSRRMRRS